MKLKKGDVVLVKVTILRQASDDCPEERGYLIETDRGSTAYVNVDSIQREVKA